MTRCALAQAIPYIESEYCFMKQALTATKYDAEIFDKFRQLCGRTGLLPASHIIPENSSKMAEHLIASHSPGDVQEGTYNDKRVAIKVLRMCNGNDVKEARKVIHSASVISRWRL